VRESDRDRRRERERETEERERVREREREERSNISKVTAVHAEIELDLRHFDECYPVPFYPTFACPLSILVFRFFLLLLLFFHIPSSLSIPILQFISFPSLLPWLS
jgi:hypothetical protein